MKDESWKQVEALCDELGTRMALFQISVAKETLPTPDAGSAPAARFVFSVDFVLPSNRILSYINETTLYLDALMKLLDDREGLVKAFILSVYKTLGEWLAQQGQDIVAAMPGIFELSDSRHFAQPFQP